MTEFRLKVALLVAIIALLAGLLIYQQFTKVNFDKTTWCPLNRDVVRHIVFLVDQTDPLTQNQKDYLLGRVKGMRSELQRFDRVSIYTIGDQGALLDRKFSLCNPGSKADFQRDWSLEVTNTPSVWEQQYRKGFEAPLFEVADELTRAQSLSFSHISETIALITHDPDFSDTLQYRRLVVLSDFLENTPTYTQYNDRSAGDLSLDRYLRSLPPNAVKPDLNGVDVQLVYLARDNGQKVQSQQHLDFWTSFLKHYGAGSVDVAQPRPVR